MEYPSDNLNNELIKSMTLSQRGLLWTIRNYCWVNGDVPANLTKLSQLLSVKESELKKAFEDGKIQEFLKLSEDGQRFCCPDLDAYRQELLAKQIRRQQNGKSAADKQWSDQRNGNAITREMGLELNRNDFDSELNVKGYALRMN
jgi:radical SAM superfamily enzyme